MSSARFSNRDSNMELLRIISMLLIVSSHFATHGAWDRSSLNVSSEVVLGIIQIGGEVGVNCFVLISGYYLIEARLKLISLARTWGQTFFYSIAILCVVFLAGGDLDVSDVVRSFIPVSSSLYWFVTAFMGMMLLSPLLRRVSSGLSEQGWRYLLFLLFVIMSFIPTITTFDFAFTKIGWFCFVFLVGGYVRLHCGKRLRDAKVKLLVGNYILIAASIVVITLASTRWPALLVHKTYFVEMNIFLEFALSLGLFLVFRDLSIGSNNFINRLASYAFGVYLITDNPLVRSYVWGPFAFAYQEPALLIAVLSIGVAAALYLVCSVIDSARAAFIEPPFVKCLSNGKLSAAFGSIESKLRSIEEREESAPSNEGGERLN